jgi:hypothetical protein
MFHLLGYTQSQDSAILVPAAALADQSLQVNGNDIIVPNDLTNVIFAYALGPNVTRAQLVAPSLRRMFNEEIFPVDTNAIATDQRLISFFGNSPLLLDPGEPLEGWMAEGAAGASRVTILAAIADAPPIPVVGDVHAIRVTSTGAAVANAWTNITLTFNDVLPSGTYALVGAALQSATMQAFRFVFKGGSYRPGAIGSALISSRVMEQFRNGGMGSWGEFENLTPPSVDVLCNAADASFQGVLDLIQLSGAR